MASFRYDFFKAELLKTPYFDDNIFCHFTASFAAVRFPVPRLSVLIIRSESNHKSIA